MNSRKQAFQTAMRSMKNVEEAKELLEKVKLTKIADSLGHLIEMAEKRTLFYEEMTKKNEEIEKIDGIEMDEVVKKVLEQHFAEFEMEKRIEMMTLGEWIGALGLEENSTTDVFSSHWTEENRLKFAKLIFSPILDEKYPIVDYFERIIKELEVTKKQIQQLLCLNLEKLDEKIGWNQFFRIAELVKEMDDEEEEGEIFAMIDKTTMNCKSVSHAILLMSLNWCAKRRKAENEKKLTTDWDTVAPESEHLDSMLLCLHAIKLAQKLRDDEEEKLRILDLVLKVDSFCRESVAKWIVDDEIKMEQIDTIFPKDPAEDLEDQNHEERLKNLKIKIPSEKLEIVNLMFQIIPRGFEHDLVIADVCWEMMSRWFRKPDSNFGLLEKSKTHLERSVTDRRLRHGVARLIWEKFLAARFEAVVTFVEKTGRMPKERESQKEVGFSEIHVVDFLTQCTAWLQVLQDAVKGDPQPKEWRQDGLIEMANASFASFANLVEIRKDQQLAEIANRQTLVNYHLIMHHFHLSLAIQLQLTVGLRLHTMSKIFCLVGNRAFFVRLDSHPLIPLDRVDQQVLENRVQFLTDVAEMGTVDERRLARILEIDWRLTVSAIQFMQALTAFRMGNDEVGEGEMVQCIRDEPSTKAVLRVLAARMWKLKREKRTKMLDKHEDLMKIIADDEISRIELYETDDPKDRNPKTWEEAIRRLGRSTATFSQSTSTAVPLVQLNDIALQYWGFRWM